MDDLMRKAIADFRAALEAAEAAENKKWLEKKGNTLYVIMPNGRVKRRAELDIMRKIDLGRE
jgi:hypothetical protein